MLERLQEEYHDRKVEQMKADVEEDRQLLQQFKMQDNESQVLSQPELELQEIHHDVPGKSMLTLMQEKAELLAKQE